MFGSRTKGRTRRTTVATLAGLALAAGLIALPAAPAAAAICKVNSANDPTESQIQDIIDNAPANGTVTFSGTCFGNFSIDKNLKIVGAGSAATVDGEDDASVFWTDGPVVVSFTNLTITNGSSMGGGGVYIDNAGIATFSKVRFTDNYALGGAAIYAAQMSTVNVVSSSFVDNYAEGSAGAIYATEARVSITGSTFSGNFAGYAGALYVDNCNDLDSGLPVTISRSTFTRNTATTDGGAIILDTVPATISASTFTGNQAASNGGAIYIYDDCNDDLPFAITGSTFTANRGGWGGGLAAIATGHAAFTSSKFVSNVANEGGAIAINSTVGATFTTSTFTGNQATEDSGGAIYGVGLYFGGEGVHLDRSTFTGNRSQGIGGAVAMWYGATTDLDITGSTFTRNAAGALEWTDRGYFLADRGGGAVFAENYNLTVSGSSFTSNSTLGDGGAIFFSGYPDCANDATFTRSVIKSNSAVGAGGGIYISGHDGCTDVALASTTVSGNSAYDGGGIYLHGYSGNGDDDNYWMHGILSTDAATRIDGNRARYDGGGILVADWDVNLMGSISGNSAGDQGGGVYVTSWQIDVDLYLSALKLERNTAVLAGGGLYINGDTEVDTEISDWDGPVSISYNKVTSMTGVGGGIYAYDPDYFDISTPWYVGGTDYTVVIAYNKALGDGGGIFAEFSYDDTYFDPGVLITKNTNGGLYSHCWLDGLDGAVITGNSGYQDYYLGCY